MSRRWMSVVAAGIVLMSCVACGTQGLSFKKDDRLKITAPRDRAAVHLPVRISWTVHGFTVTGATGTARPDAGYFGVYLDRAPQPPGETLAWFARDDSQCKVLPGCPDRAYFASKDAYTTTQTSFVISRLPEVRPEEQRKYRDLHEVAVVLLDGKGRRIGESSFSVEFELKRNDT